MKYYILAAFIIVVFFIGYSHLSAGESKYASYIIVESGNPDDLEKAVESKIGQGYKPVGGVAVSGKYIYQAMTR